MFMIFAILTVSLGIILRGHELKSDQIESGTFIAVP
jgi:hypothetical protein